MHPYKKQARDNNPRWIKGLETPAEHKAFQRADLKATLRDKTANPAVTAQAAYAKKGK